ncbi:MAG: hypothetical protein ACK502_08915 [Alphaproteobacteria bacterium]
MKSPFLHKKIINFSILIVFCSLVFFPEKPAHSEYIDQESVRVLVTRAHDDLPLAEEVFINFNSATFSRAFTIETVAKTPNRKTNILFIGTDNKFSIEKMLVIEKQLAQHMLKDIIRTYPAKKKPLKVHVSQRLLDELGLPLGGGFRINGISFVSIGIISALPQKQNFLTNTLPDVLMKNKDFHATRLLGSSNNIQYHYEVSLPKNIPADTWIESFKKKFSQSTAKIQHLQHQK